MGSCLSQEPEVDFEGPVDFNHFQILRAIGKGAFGKVCIVKKKDTKQMYALKYMNKVQMIHKHALENVFREIKILRSVEHTFLVNLWFTFHDREDIFMVLDLMLGGDISYHLEKAGRFSVDRVRLYLAELALALDYLRDRHIIHRDIKPANMLLDSQGHVHVTDFNVATMARANHPISSTTGTKPYMAPEVIQTSARGYSYPVDWWGLGVSAYEMLRGSRPFSIDKHITSSAMHTLLTKTRPSASASWDKDTCDILKMLLHPDEDKRLQSAATLRSHPFFHSLNWEEVEQKKATPPFIPPQNRINCDPTHELEEMIVEPNPLHKKQHRLSKRNQRTEDEAVEKELAKIDEKFKVYNRQSENEKTAAAKEAAKKPLEESTESGTQAEELASGSHEGEGVESASKTSRNSQEVGEAPVEDKHLSVSAAAWNEADNSKPSSEENKTEGKANVEEKAEKVTSVVEVEVGVEGEETGSPSRVEGEVSPSKVGVMGEEPGTPPRVGVEESTTPPTEEGNGPESEEKLSPTNLSEGDQKQCDSDAAVTQPCEGGVDNVTGGGVANVVPQQAEYVKPEEEKSSNPPDDKLDRDAVKDGSRSPASSGPGGEANGLVPGESGSSSSKDRLKSEVVSRSEALEQEVVEEREALETVAAGHNVEPEQNGLAASNASTV